jgi:hypothetical protein
MKIQEEPTKRKANCYHCDKVISGNLPRLWIWVPYGWNKSYKKYVCLSCAKSHAYSKEIVNEYEKLLNSDKWSIIVVAENI